MRRQLAILCGLLAGLAVALTAFSGGAFAQTRVASPEDTRAISVEPTPSTDSARRDYELAERVGTKAAWDAFLAVHPSGYFATLARSQREKLGGGSDSGGLQTSDPDAGQTDASNLSRITVLPPPGSKITANKKVASLPNTASDASPDGATGANKAVPIAKPLVCSKGKIAQGKGCVAAPVVEKPLKKKEAARAPEPSPRERARERARENASKARVRVREERFSRPVQARASCPAGSSPMPQGGRMCCETTPERGAPRIFCM